MSEFTLQPDFSQNKDLEDDDFFLANAAHVLPRREPYISKPIPPLEMGPEERHRKSMIEAAKLGYKFKFDDQGNLIEEDKFNAFLALIDSRRPVEIAQSEQPYIPQPREPLQPPDYLEDVLFLQRGPIVDTEQERLARLLDTAAHWSDNTSPMLPEFQDTSAIFDPTAIQNGVPTYTTELARASLHEAEQDNLAGYILRVS